MGSIPINGFSLLPTVEKKMFDFIAGIVTAVVSTVVTCSSPNMGEQSATDLASRLTGNNHDMQGIAIVSSLVAGKILSTPCEVLKPTHSNSVAVLEDTNIEELDVKPTKLIYAIVQQKTIALITGMVIGAAMSSILKSNTSLAISAAITAVAGTGNIKKSVGIVAGLVISKLALMALSTITLNPISALVIGIFFLPTQITNLLFGKEEKILSQSINTNVPKFDLNLLKDIFNIQVPAVSMGSCTILSSFLEGLGIGSKINNQSLMIGKSTIQALLPDNSIEYILAAIAAIGISIPLIPFVTRQVCKWCFANPRILAVLGIVINSIFLCSYIGILNATIITVIGFVAKTIIPASFMRILFFGGMI